MTVTIKVKISSVTVLTPDNSDSKNPVVMTLVVVIEVVVILASVSVLATSIMLH